MKERVEKMLTSRIRQVFEEFDDPSADAGWDELRKKYPPRHRRPLILWLSSAAAILILATGLWSIDQSAEMIAVKPTKDQQELINPKRETRLNAGNPVNEALKNNDPVLSQRKGLTHEPQIEDGKEAFTDAVEHRAEASKLPAANDPKYIISEQVMAPGLAGELQISKAILVASKGQEAFPIIAIDPDKKPVYLKEVNFNVLKNRSAEKLSDQETKKLALSVFAGSYVNFAEGSENQLNFGAGFNSDIRLTRKLKVSTGLSIASYSFSYDNAQNLPAGAYLSFDSANTSSSPGTGNLTTITGYNADLLALDIPVNIKYQFIPESDKLYILAGLSSGTYLNETYSYYYRSFNTSSGKYVSQTQDQKIKKQLNDFDFGQIINLSVGLSRNFGKTQTISIEPFLKHPLGGLGSEDLKFGSAGVNLKLRFAPLKK